MKLLKGYDCCEGCEVAYTDADGKWGYENDEWCGIKEDCDATKPKTTPKKSSTKNTATTTTNKAPVSTQKCKCQYEACGPNVCCGAGLSCIEKDG